MIYTNTILRSWRIDNSFLMCTFLVTKKSSSCLYVFLCGMKKALETFAHIFMLSLKYFFDIHSFIIKSLESTD